MVSKGKAANPVQAARKAARAREIKKNKENRAQARETSTLRKDTHGIQKQIRDLEHKPQPSKQEQADLERLRSELKKINDIKEAFIAKHPEQRKTVAGYEKTEQELAKEREEANRAAADANAPVMATPTRDRSVHYDPVFNPYGAPPPGLPYMEKPFEQLLSEGLIQTPPLPAGDDDDSDGDASDDDDDLDGIIMPDGPPPLPPGPPPPNSDDEEDDDDIALPLGPPPGSIPTGPKNPSFRARPPPTSSVAHGAVPPPQGPSYGHAGPPRAYAAPAPRPPLPSSGVGRGASHSRGGSRGGHHARPPRGAAQHTIDPITGLERSSQTFHQQAHPSASLPSRPPPPSAPSQPPPGAVISAEPQLRDLRKETTVFVPAAIRKKRAQEKSRVKMGLPAKVDAAPSRGLAGSADQEGSKPDLMQALRPHLGDASGQGASSSSKAPQEYDKFLHEIGDLL